MISGEYQKMQDTFAELGYGLALAAVLIYFIMVGLDKSLVVPLTVMLTVPFALIGILPMLLVTGSAVNVQSILGVIFIVGIKVSNTVLMTDYAQELRREEGLTPDPGDPQGGVGPGPAGDDDRAGRILRDGPGCAGSGAGERGERAAGPGDPRGTARRRAGHALHPADALLAAGPRQAGACRWGCCETSRGRAGCRPGLNPTSVESPSM